MGVINKTTAAINDLLDKVEGMPEEGVVGKTPVLETGETTTLDPGQNATSEVVSNGTDESGNPKYKLNLGIPRGANGASGGGGGTADSVDWSNVQNKPSWVNSPTKPTYTAAEVGALPSTTTIPGNTSQLTNDSGFVKSTELKTINGNSIVGSGNIEISGAGGGIADAPSDGQTYGRKNGAWTAITGNTGGSVDITDIYMRLSQIAEVNGNCTDEDYNTLKGYADNGTLTYVNYGDSSLLLNINNVNGEIKITNSIDYEYASILMAISVSSSKQVTTLNHFFLPNTNLGSGFLGNYTKPTSYSAISKEDSISTAIGKLEAGLGTGGSSSDDIYYIPTDVLSLDTQATGEEIVAAFGGSDKKDELISAINAGKKIYIQGSGEYSTIPVVCRSLYSLVAYISFIRRNNILYPEIVNIAFAPYSNIEVICPNGYKVNSSINMLTSNSTSDEISSALGGIDGVKKLKKIVEDGNAIYTVFKSVQSTEVKSTRFNLSVVISTDDNNYYIGICGVQGEGYSGWIDAGCLYITYDIASNTFTCIRWNKSISIDN